MEPVPSSKLPVDFYQSKWSQIMYLFTESIPLSREVTNIQTHTHTYPFPLCFMYTHYTLHVTQIHM